ncbi:hypothetical protein ACFX13_007795 [Malus domestica]
MSRRTWLTWPRETNNVAWDSAKNTTRKVTDTLVAEADENVVDTAEYRTIEDLSTFADQNDHHQKEGSHLIRDENYRKGYKEKM